MPHYQDGRGNEMSITQAMSAEAALAYYRAESDSELIAVVEEHKAALSAEERLELILYMVCHMTGHLQHIMNHLGLESDTDSLEQVADRVRKN